MRVNFFMNMLEDKDPNDFNDESDPIEFEDLSKEAVEKVIEFCKYNETIPLPEIEKPL